MTSQIRKQRIREKFELDQAHIQYLLTQGWHPFEIADHMTQYMIDALREGLRHTHPDWDEPQILQEMRNKMLLIEKMRFRRGIRNDGRT
jgi:hypothetical protein